MKRLTALAAALLAATASLANAGEAPVVVELYTSHGCSSCPPADQVLTDLTTLPGVLPLSIHVNYWDRLGWPDPFASATGTERQAAYSPSFRRGYVYTPQMIIDGVEDVIGSERHTVMRLVEERRASRSPVAIDLAAAAAGEARLRVSGPDVGLSRLTLFAFDRHHEREVGAGENAGRRLANSNVVRAIVDLGQWSGATVDRAIALPDPGDGRDFAVVVQRIDAAGTPGEILGAARLVRN